LADGLKSTNKQHVILSYRIYQKDTHEHSQILYCININDYDGFKWITVMVIITKQPIIRI